MTMPTRRDFFTAAAAAGIAFFDRRPAAAQAPAPRRRQVMVGGRRVTTVDMHAHCGVPEAMALMGANANAGGLTDVFTRGASAPERLRTMDQQGIDIEVLSINPTWYAAERDLARRIIDIQNEKLSELCAAYPDRFVALASVAFQHPDLAAEQLEQGVKKWKLRGAAIGGHVN